MAKGRLQETVTPAITIIKPAIVNKTIILELTEAEAQVLAFITRHIGGEPGQTQRKYFDAIGVALREAGINRYARDYRLADQANSIYFTE